MKDPNFERKKHETHRMSERVRAQHRPGCDLKPLTARASPAPPPRQPSLSRQTNEEKKKKEQKKSSPQTEQNGKKIIKDFHR